MEHEIHQNWYVYVGEQVYGPFSQDVMISFVGEGRVIAASLISMHADKNFLPASQFQEFTSWLQGEPYRPIPVTPAQPAASPQHAATQINAPTQQAAQVTPIKAGPNIFIVMAEVDGRSAMGFLRSLQKLGYVQRIGDAMWILKSDWALDHIRASIAPTITKRDRLFIHDCVNNKQAWENIGADLDQRLITLWQEL